MGSPAEALKGTNVRKENKLIMGPDVPPLKFRDAPETIDAIGRAWAGRLLEGREIESVRLRDRARGIFGLYWRLLPLGPDGSVSSLYRNMVSDPRQAPRAHARPLLLQDEAEEREREQEATLLRILGKADQQGRDKRKAFDELVIDPNPERGPPWLDRLLSQKQQSPADLQRLEDAVSCLIAVLR